MKFKVGDQVRFMNNKSIDTIIAIEYENGRQIGLVKTNPEFVDKRFTLFDECWTMLDGWYTKIDGPS